MAEVNEEEVVRGLLPFVVNGETRNVPELKWRANRHWQEQIVETFRRLAKVDAGSPEGQREMADAQRGLVLAYDETGALGDLEDATERELDAIYTRLMEVSFPLAQSQLQVTVGIMRAAVELDLANSTSGHSPTGPSADLTTSSRPSRSVRRASSSRKPKLGSKTSSAPA